MNSWTDIALILAIVIGLISAASLPMVSVNAVSPESLRLRSARQSEPAPWALVTQGETEASRSASPPTRLAGARSKVLDLSSATSDR